MEIGRLQEIDIRELWKHEQYDFSEWLSKESSIGLLGDEIGLTLTEVEKEVYVGSYRCDLVATDEITGEKIIIENQLEATNHDHLGKIITYASGLDASIIIWIVKEAREEHRSAIEWLNNKTEKGISFFLIELHAYRIGNSLPAPKFEIIEKPNDFLKNTKDNVGRPITKLNSESLTFWTQFNEMLNERGKPFNVRKASTDHWYGVAIGKAGVSVLISLINSKNKISVEVRIDDDKELFDRLAEKASEIEEKLGFKMKWNRLNNKKASRILSYIPGLNFDDKTNYPILMNEIIDKVIVIKKVFQTYL